MNNNNQMSIGAAIYSSVKLILICVTVVSLASMTYFKEDRATTQAQAQVDYSSVWW